MEKNYTDKELELVFEKILKMYKSSYSPKEKPKVFLLGGQPGAGKTGLENMINAKDEYISISGDDFREYHPKFKEINLEHGREASKYTQQWCGAITEKLIEALGKEKYNLIIEGTLRTAELPIKEATRFKKLGYEVGLNVVAVKGEKSRLGTIQRYEEMIKQGKTPRMTPKEHHDLVVNSIGDNLETIYNSKLFDEIRLFDRENNLLYSYKETPDVSPKDILEKEFNCKWEKEEIEEYDERWNNLIKTNEINAFAMPGGKIAFYTGIMPVLNSDAGVAFVMGHEIGHVIGGHHAEASSNKALAGIAATVTDAVTGGNAVSSLVSSGLSITLLKFNRTQEYEADKYGMIFMAMAGYNPSEAITALERMNSIGSGKGAEILSTHPSGKNRIEAARKFLPEAMKYYKAR